MIKRYLIIWFAVLLATVCLMEAAQARRIKVYRLPQGIAAGQLGTIVFENPDPSQPKSRSKCTAEKLIAWVKSDVPILRIEQKGKQVWTSLGSYLTMGDSCIATFMAPADMEAGAATLYLVNDRDMSVPYPLTIAPKIEAKLSSIKEAAITPLGHFRLIGDGFVISTIVDPKTAIGELEANVGYSALSKPEQWRLLNHRIKNDWDQLPEGNFLTIEQGGKSWQVFVEQCGLEPSGIALDFIAPPDIKPGQASLTLSLRRGGQEVTKTTPLTVNVAP